MNVSIVSLRPVSGLVLCLMLLVLTGCSTPKINWAERVGKYTYDQAVIDFGPPDRSAPLSDGRIVAEWLTQRGYTQAYGTGGFGYGPYGYGPGLQTYTTSTGPDYFIRLTFGADGKLAEWKKVVK